MILSEIEILLLSGTALWIGWLLYSRVLLPWLGDMIDGPDEHAG